jgi:hypothetical protein
LICLSRKVRIERFSRLRRTIKLSFNALNESTHFSMPSISIIERTVFAPGLKLAAAMPLLQWHQLAMKGTPSIPSGNEVGRGRFIHFSWILARSPLAFILSMKELIDALISFS